MDYKKINKSADGQGLLNSWWFHKEKLLCFKIIDNHHNKFVHQLKLSELCCDEKFKIKKREDYVVKINQIMMMTGGFFVFVDFGLKILKRLASPRFMPSFQSDYSDKYGRYIDELDFIKINNDKTYQVFFLGKDWRLVENFKMGISTSYNSYKLLSDFKSDEIEAFSCLEYHYDIYSGSLVKNI